LLGVFAQIRQTLLDARWYRLQQKAFEGGGARRPPYDDSLAALLPALDGTLPVMFEAESENEIVRALRLAEEFGLRPIVRGGTDAWKQGAELAKRQVPVLVGLS